MLLSVKTLSARLRCFPHEQNSCNSCLAPVSIPIYPCSSVVKSFFPASVPACQFLRRSNLPICNLQESSGLPVRLSVVFQEFAPNVFAGVNTADDGVHDPGGAVHDIQRWME